MRRERARTRVGAAAFLLSALCTNAWADDVCGDEGRRHADGLVAKALSAEKAGDLVGALGFASEARSSYCSSGTTADDLVVRLTRRLGSDAEAAGRLEQAFEYFEQGAHLTDAKRVGLARIHARPDDLQQATWLMDFMRRHEFADGVAEIERVARSQSERLLAEENQSFAIRNPRMDLLHLARDWLNLAGDEVAASVRARAGARGDQYAALDYSYALGQGVSFYELAGREDGVAAVRAKAARVAQQKSGGEEWAEAALLYEIAGNEAQANALREQRAAQAQTSEAARQEKFKKEQDDLEKELGF
jgi:hypothetical protein